MEYILAIKEFGRMITMCGTKKHKCEWCGNPFHKTHNRQMYCSKECATNAKKEQDRRHWLKWFYKNKDHLYETQLGTRSLGPHREEDFEEEYKIIQKELKRLGLKS